MRFYVQWTDKIPGKVLRDPCFMEPQMATEKPNSLITLKGIRLNLISSLCQILFGGLYVYQSQAGDVWKVETLFQICFDSAEI